jgi:hypothetical protein
VRATCAPVSGLPERFVADGTEEGPSGPNHLDRTIHAGLRPNQNVFLEVERTRIEPVTSGVQSRRFAQEQPSYLVSSICATAQFPDGEIASSCAVLKPLDLSRTDSCFDAAHVQPDVIGSSRSCRCAASVSRGRDDDGSSVCSARARPLGIYALRERVEEVGVGEVVAEEVNVDREGECG